MVDCSNGADVLCAITGPVFFKILRVGYSFEMNIFRISSLHKPLNQILPGCFFWVVFTSLHVHIGEPRWIQILIVYMKVWHHLESYTYICSSYSRSFDPIVRIFVKIWVIVGFEILIQLCSARVQWLWLSHCICQLKRCRHQRTCLLAINLALLSYSILVWFRSILPSESFRLYFHWALWLLFAGYLRGLCELQRCTRIEKTEYNWTRKRFEWNDDK